MKKTVTFEVDDDLFETYIRPIVNKRKLSKMIANFFDLYAGSPDIRQYFEDLDTKTEKRQLDVLNSIINDKSFLQKMGLMEAELDDLASKTQNATRRGAMPDQDVSGSFEFDDDDTSYYANSSESNNTGYATKADIARIEDTMAEILKRLDGSVTINSSQKQTSKNTNSSFGVDDTGGYLTTDTDEDGEDASDVLGMLDQMFTF